VLLYRAPLGQLSRARLNAIRDTNDGFEIAQRDLELRGPGELLGTRQTGLAQMRVADLSRDSGTCCRGTPGGRTDAGAPYPIESRRSLRAGSEPTNATAAYGRVG
jgi:hypothetical protein